MVVIIYSRFLFKGYSHLEKKKYIYIYIYIYKIINKTNNIFVHFEFIIKYVLDFKFECKIKICLYFKFTF